MQPGKHPNGKVRDAHPWQHRQSSNRMSDTSQTLDSASLSAVASSSGGALGIITTPVPLRQQQQQLGAGTPNSMVLDRMLELESVIATVKSSLDNHASSYYSVASQIAELNARIGRMGISSKLLEAVEDTNRHQARPMPTSPSPRPRQSVVDAACSKAASCNTSAECSSTTNPAQADASDKESSDEHYTRIQEMINSLIKDADLALNSKPGHNHSHASFEDSLDIFSLHEPLLSPDQLSSVSTVFEEPPAFTFSSDYTRKPAAAATLGSNHMPLAPRSASRPTFKNADCFPDTRLLRPASALGSSPRLSRSRKLRSQAPVAKHTLTFEDPEEADAEPDADFGTTSTFGQHGRPTSRQCHNDSFYYRQPRLQHRRNSGSYSDRHAGARWTGRQRSDTVDSFLSNSSETCVSPGNRASREFGRPSFSQGPFAQSHVLTDSLCTPTRAWPGPEGASSYVRSHASPRLVDRYRHHAHQFPCLPLDDQQEQRQQQWLDNEEEEHQRSTYQQRQLAHEEGRGIRTPASPFSDSSKSTNVPLIRRFRNSVTRAVLRSASFVDESINDDIAAHESAARDMPTDLNTRLTPRERSNTSVNEMSTMFSGPLSGGLSVQCDSPANMEWRAEDGSPVMSDDMRWNSHARMQHESRCEFVPRSLPPSLWTRRKHGGDGNSRLNRREPALGLQVERINQPVLMRNTLQALETDAGGGSIRLPDSIEEYDSNCERIPALQTLASTGQDVMLPLPEDNGTSSLVSMISLLYWTLLFTLGALMLDSFLCQVAGKRVMGTVDKIAQLEVSIDDEKAGEDRDVRRGPPTRSANRDTANVSNTVGRFVRWYIEGPEELVSSGSSSMSGAAPRSLRARKSSTLRGSFRHIE